MISEHVLGPDFLWRLAWFHISPAPWGISSGFQDFSTTAFVCRWAQCLVAVQGGRFKFNQGRRWLAYCSQYFIDMKIVFVIFCLASPLFAMDILAHRGGPRDQFKASSLAAFRNSIEYGIIQLESDLHLTADNHIVLSHDPVLRNRKNLVISKMTLNQVNQDAQQNHDAIVTIADMAELAKQYPHIRFQFEVKYPLLGDSKQNLYKSREETISVVLSQLKALNIFDRTTIASFDEITLSQIRKLEPSAVLMYNYRGGFLKDPENRTCSALCFLPNWEQALLFVAENRIDIFSPSQVLLTSKVIQALNPSPDILKKDSTAKRNFKLYTWTVNSSQELDSLNEYGIDGVISDYPTDLKTYLSTTRQ